MSPQRARRNTKRACRIRLIFSVRSVPGPSRRQPGERLRGLCVESPSVRVPRLLCGRRPKRMETKPTKTRRRWPWSKGVLAFAACLALAENALAQQSGLAAIISRKTRCATRLPARKVAKPWWPCERAGVASRNPFSARVQNGVLRGGDAHPPPSPPPTPPGSLQNSGVCLDVYVSGPSADDTSDTAATTDTLFSVPAFRPVIPSQALLMRSAGPVDAPEPELMPLPEKAGWPRFRPRPPRGIRARVRR